MAKVKIRKSVGHKGKNELGDTKAVQKLLNGHTKAGGFKKLGVDGLVGPKTIGSIRGFQKKVMGSKADGRVDPGHKTIAALNQKPGSVEPAGGGSGSGGGSSKKKKKGGTSGGAAEIKELETRIKEAKKQITLTRADIANHYSYSANFKDSEGTILETQKRYRMGFKLMRTALKKEDEAKRAKEIDKVCKALRDSASCMIKVEKDAKSIEGAKYKPGIIQEIRSLQKKIKDIQTTERLEKLDKIEGKVNLVYRLMSAMFKTLRIGNEAYILLLKGKLIMFEISVKDANKQLQTLNKGK